MKFMFIRLLDNDCLVNLFFMVFYVLFGHLVGEKKSYPRLAGLNLYKYILHFELLSRNTIKIKQGKNSKIYSE